MYLLNLLYIQYYHVRVFRIFLKFFVVCLNYKQGYTILLKKFQVSMKTELFGQDLTDSGAILAGQIKC